MTAPLAYDVFNGDADGICALLQLRLCQPRSAQLVTGVKRDIALLGQVPATAPATVTVLDVSLDVNAAALHGLLAGGCHVDYYDHHAARLRFAHPRLRLAWDDAPDVCTGILVDRQLGGRQRRWAVVAAFGDNLAPTARTLAKAAGLDGASTAALATLGRLINYNAYGDTVADLHCAPQALYRELLDCGDPLVFVAASTCYARLAAGYRADRQQLEVLRPYWQDNHGTVYVLPPQAWARRISGVLANRLIRQQQQGGCAVLTENADGSFVVSVRSGEPLLRAANLLCDTYPTGGGRTGAAGINRLPADALDSFIAQFSRYFSAAPGAAATVAGTGQGSSTSTSAESP